MIAIEIKNFVCFVIFVVKNLKELFYTESRGRTVETGNRILRPLRGPGG